MTAIRSGRRPVRLAVAAVLGLAVAGCGVGAGDAPEDVGLRISDGFGDLPTFARTPVVVEGEDTVIRLLQRNATVETSGGGSFVESIEGRAGGEQVGDSAAYWIFFRNGNFSDQGAADVRVRSGDRIWWDRHDGRIANVRAVVGSFPMPFVEREADGASVPVELGCADPAGAACTTAAARLDAAGVEVTAGALRPDARSTALRVLVGTWDEVRRDPVAARLESGPKTSGVLAQIRGRAIIPYRVNGRARTTLPDGWGIVAALRPGREPATWVVTGPSDADTEAAAEQLTAEALAGRFALLVSDGTAGPLPVEEEP